MSSAATAPVLRSGKIYRGNMVSPGAAVSRSGCDAQSVSLNGGTSEGRLWWTTVSGQL